MGFSLALSHLEHFGIWMLETVRCLKLTPISIKQELKGQWEPTVIIVLSWWSPLTSLYRFSSKYGYVDTYNNHEHTSKINWCMTQPENSNIGIFRIPEDSHTQPPCQWANSALFYFKAYHTTKNGAMVQSLWGVGILQQKYFCRKRAIYNCGIRFELQTLCTIFYHF
jgi:hypothetical protein